LDNGDNIWLWICIACLIGWLTTIYLFRRRKNSSVHTERNTSQAAPTATETPAICSSSPSLQQVISCAQAHQAAQTRRALNQWIATLNLDAQKPSLDIFLRQSEEPLRQEILFLDQYLYANNNGKNPTETTWDGTTLAQELQQWQKNRPIKKGEEKFGDKEGNTCELPSFYPDNR